MHYQATPIDILMETRNSYLLCNSFSEGVNWFAHNFLAQQFFAQLWDAEILMFDDTLNGIRS